MFADHFAFQVSDLDVSIKFYQEKLGLELMSKTVDEEHHEAFAFLKLDGCNIELLQLLDEKNNPIPAPENEIKPPYSPHMAIGTDNLEALVEKLKSAQIDILKGPMLIPDMVTWLYITDPDNNVLEFVQWLNK